MMAANIFEPVLIDPIRRGANKLYIVSGYATAAMAFHHLETVRAAGFDIGIELIVGMTSLDGISTSNHKGFQSLADSYGAKFVCSYVMNLPPVHSKVYAWCRSGNPVEAFIGSPNYTQNAFLKQREAISTCNPKRALDYFRSLLSDTIFCTHNDVEDFIRIHKQVYVDPESGGVHSPKPTIGGLRSITVSLLTRTGEIHKAAGLNWGQRDGREKNQAYIPLQAPVVRSDFFPVKGIHFTINTDDGKILICTRAQGDLGGKAIETPHNNSLLGEYFRNRIGLPSGAFVTKQALIDYGRTDVTFYKIDDETYFMDFSV